MIPAQTSSVSSARCVIVLACRWAQSEEGNAVLEEVVVSAIELNERDVLVTRTC